MTEVGIESFASLTSHYLSLVTIRYTKYRYYLLIYANAPISTLDWQQKLLSPCTTPPRVPTDTIHSYRKQKGTRFSSKPDVMPFGD